MKYFAICALLVAFPMRGEPIEACRAAPDGGYFVTAFATTGEAEAFLEALPRQQRTRAQRLPDGNAAIVIANRCDAPPRMSDQARRIPGVDIDSDGIRLQYLTTNGYGLYDGDRRVAFMWCDRDSLYLYENTTALILDSFGGGVLDFNGTKMQINGTKVLGVQGAPVANADGTLQSLTIQFNELLSRLRDHGLIGR